MKTTAIIVDDEPLAREMVKEYLEDFPEVHVIAECENGRQAVEKITRLDPDLVFLDVQMPVMTGFKVLENLKNEKLPQIIFSTAYDEFALQAFEVSAVDYLLKPYSRERFRAAIQKALKQTPINVTDTDRLLALVARSQSKKETAFSDRLFVRTHSKIVPIKVDKILWVEAAGDYAQLHTSEKSYLSNLGIGELEKRLDPKKFPRVHRSFIIAISALKHLQSDGEGGYYATLVNGQKIKISRTYAPQVREIIV